VGDAAEGRILMTLVSKLRSVVVLWLVSLFLVVVIAVLIVILHAALVP
jgi:hypothetical protein